MRHKLLTVILMSVLTPGNQEVAACDSLQGHV